MSDLFSCNKKLPASLQSRIREMYRSCKVGYKKVIRNAGNICFSFSYYPPPPPQYKKEFLPFGNLSAKFRVISLYALKPRNDFFRTMK
jgi:hypothetical protein